MEKLGDNPTPTVAAKLRVELAPIPLNEAQRDAATAWAADDRLWTTQETVEANLLTFARVILRNREQV
jgi:hypothetical protein